jgi:hypothetical protein
MAADSPGINRRDAAPAYRGRQFVPFVGCQASHVHSWHRGCVAAVPRINSTGIVPYRESTKPRYALVQLF